MSENPKRIMQHLVPPKLLVHIGDITVSFALLELHIQTLVGSLLSNKSRIGQIITAELSFRNLRALAISLYLELRGEDEDFAVFRKLMQRAGKMEETRNAITHSVWAAGNTADTVTRFKTTAKERQGIQFQFVEVSESYLAKVAQDLKLLASEILDFG